MCCLQIFTFNSEINENQIETLLASTHQILDKFNNFSENMKSNFDNLNDKISAISNQQNVLIRQTQHHLQMYVMVQGSQVSLGLNFLISSEKLSYVTNVSAIT